MARERIRRPELGLKKNDDKDVATSLERDKKEYTSLNLFITAMKQSISYVAISHNSNGWKIQITYKDSKARTISSKFLEKRSITELYILRNKVRKDYLDNYLLIERIEELMNEVEVEIHEKPY